MPAADQLPLVICTFWVLRYRYG